MSESFVLILVISLIGYVLYKKNKNDAIREQLERQENIDLISRVTPIFRGTSTERFLILNLLE